MNNRARFAPALLLLLAGCDGIFVGVDGFAGKVEIRTLESVYRPLDPAVAVVRNTGTEPVFRDPCFGRMEGRRTPDAAWSGDHGSGRACLHTGGAESPPLIRLGPGQSFTDTLHIPWDAYEGEWRFQYRLLDARGRLLPLERRVSNVFRVVRDDAAL